MLQDIRTAIRAIVKDKWLSAAAVVALALGIGVNTTVFTLVNAVLIRGLPFPDSDNLYVLGTQRLPVQGAGGEPGVLPGAPGLARGDESVRRHRRLRAVLLQHRR